MLTYIYIIFWGCISGNDALASHHDNHEDHHHQHLRKGQRRMKMPGHRDHFCGEAPVGKDFKPVVVPQDYYGPENQHIKERRRLYVQQNYSEIADQRKVDAGCCPNPATGCFMNVSEAIRNDLAGPLRLKFVWDLVNATDLEDVGMCSKPGTFERVFYGNLPEARRTISCKKGESDPRQENLVTENKKANLADRLKWVENYVRKTFTVKRVRDAIVIQDDAIDQYYRNTGNKAGYPMYPNIQRRHEDVDLLIIITMNPPEASGVAGYAFCAQQDQWGRCTVGFFNWVSTTITGNPIIALTPNIISSERATALHETMHVLGLKRVNSAGNNFFRDEYGCKRPDDWLFEDSPQSSGENAVVKQVRHWKTPLVLQLAREQFGCETLKGVPMEDVPLGFLAHWEARVMGPDVMSYGIGSGETYVSDITLAFFQDSGQYLVNFTCGSTHTGECGGGRLLAPTGVDEALTTRSFSSSLFSKADDANEEGMTSSREDMSPGFIRWGRLQGCSFVNKKPTPENWGNRYTCQSANAYGCTPDNRMSAVCILNQYGTTQLGLTNAAEKFPCPPANSGPSCTQRTNQGLPQDYRYFTGEKSDWGGHSESMDYAPVRVGYWNCMDEKPSLQTAIETTEGMEVNYGDAFSQLDSNIPNFGGQIRSSKSRCFSSSLTAFSEFINFNPDFPAYGLCYAANCYKADYLQFGVKGVGGIKWYGCSKDMGGQKLYIPGYIGAFTCPDPIEFCAHEDITGKLYTENNQTFEWIVWGVGFGIFIVLVIVFCCVKKARQWATSCCKKCVGFEAKSKHEIEHDDCRAVPKVLLALCALWAMVGLALIIMSVLILAVPDWFWESAPRQVYHIIAIGILTSIVSSFGIAGARSRGPNLKICFFFYTVMCVMIFFVLLAAMAAFLQNLFMVLMEQAWDNFRVQFPASMAGMSANEARAHIEKIILENGIYIWPVVIAIILSVILASAFSGVVLKWRNIKGTMDFFGNAVMFILGILFLVAGSFIAQVLGRSDTLSAYIVPSMLPGGFVLVSGLLGNLHLAPCLTDQARIRTMWAHVIIGGMSSLALIGTGIFFLIHADTLGVEINKLPDEDLSSLLQAMSISGTWTIDSVREILTASFRAFGIDVIVITIVQIFTIVTGTFLLIRTRKKYEQYLTEKSARVMARSEEGNAEWLQGGIVDAQDILISPSVADLNDIPNAQNLYPNIPNTPGDVEMSNFASLEYATVVSEHEGDRL